MMAQYRGVPLGELSPHVYAIAEQVGEGGGGGGWPGLHPGTPERAPFADIASLLPARPQAYAAMMADGERQAILISGESGAGKTESAKLVMQVRGGGALVTIYSKGAAVS